MIRVRNLVKKFGELTAVNDISFEVRQGEIFAFLGPNGAGKTTTLKMLTTLLTQSSITEKSWPSKPWENRVVSGVGVLRHPQTFTS